MKLWQNVKIVAALLGVKSAAPALPRRDAPEASGNNDFSNVLAIARPR